SLAHARGGGPRAMHAGGPGMGRGPAMNRGGGMSRGGMGGGHGGGRGGGRRSDIRLKHDVVLLGHFDNGLGLYSFVYGGSDKRYVGVIAQEVLGVAPWAVSRGADGYLRVDYRQIGVPFQSFAAWRASATPSLVPVGDAD
ncbi:tail fiber domain-containing protein, partial [Bosea rubneri]